MATRSCQRECARGAEAGYSLAEMLVVLLLASVILTVAVPMTLDTIRSSRGRGAAHEVLAQIRRAQSMSVMRGDVFTWQWGPSTSYPASEFRLVRDLGSCSFPANTASEDDVDVIRDWIDVSQEYPGVTIQSVLDDNGNTVGGVMFNALGASVNSCGTVTFPVRVTVADATGATHVIEIHAAGGTRFM